MIFFLKLYITHHLNRPAWQVNALVQVMGGLIWAGLIWGEWDHSYIYIIP